MTPLFKKLNLKDHKDILVLNAPESFRNELAAITPFVKVIEEDNLEAITFVLIFVTKKKAVDTTIKALAPKFKDDVVVWYCYPKASSKEYTCDFNRDNGWRVLGTHDLEGVRQVSIDQDWSALRFRRIDYIKSFKRNKNMVLSVKGKRRVEDQKR